MAKKRIFYFSFLTNPEAFERTLTQDGDIELVRLEHSMPEREIEDVLKSAYGYQIRGNWRDVPDAYRGHTGLIERCPNLLAISTGGAGYDTIHVDECTAAGVLAVNQAGQNAEAVSEHAVGMMLSLTKKIAQVNQALRRDRNWVRRDYTNNDIYGKTLGIVGLGQIGTRVAEICRLAFGMEALAVHPRIDAAEAKRRGAELCGTGRFRRVAGAVGFRPRRLRPQRRDPRHVRRGSLREDEAERLFHHHRARRDP